MVMVDYPYRYELLTRACTKVDGGRRPAGAEEEQRTTPAAKPTLSVLLRGYSKIMLWDDASPLSTEGQTTVCTYIHTVIRVSLQW